MRKEFIKWMTEEDGKKENVAAQYSAAISYISKHFSKQNKKNIDLYKIDDIDFINELVEKYKTGGEFEKIGKERSGAVRAAIKAYARFLKNTKLNYDSHKEGKHPESNNKKEFKEWMISQKNLELGTASNYITGINKISNHYSQINNKRIDLLNINDKILINGLVREYSQGGIYEEIGNIGHAYVRAAIIAYAKYLEYKKDPQKNNVLFDSDKTIIKSLDIRDKKKKLLPNNKHEIFIKAFDFMLPVLPEFIGNILQKKDKNTWWQKFVLNKLPPNAIRNLPKNRTYEEYINKLDISLCIKIIIENWKNIFINNIKNIKFSWVHELIEIRNDISHWSTEKSNSYTYESISHTLNTMILFMRSIDNSVADQILELKREFEGKYKNE